MLYLPYLYAYKLFLGSGERFNDISGNNVEHSTYMTDADNNSLDIVDSDMNLHVENTVKHDTPAGGFYKVLNILLLKY